MEENRKTGRPLNQVWKHFQRVVNNDEHHANAKCIYCTKYLHSAQVGRLKRHLSICPLAPRMFSIGVDVDNPPP